MSAPIVNENADKCILLFILHKTLGRFGFKAATMCTDCFNLSSE